MMMMMMMMKMMMTTEAGVAIFQRHRHATFADVVDQGRRIESSPTSSLRRHDIENVEQTTTTTTTKNAK